MTDTPSQPIKITPFKFKLVNRCDPYPLFLAVRSLAEKPKLMEAVREIGFGKILCFQVASIPEKLAAHVIDKFDDVNMELDLDGRKIKVDTKSIRKLLGIPILGLELSIGTGLEVPIIHWIWRYRDTITPGMILDKIEMTSDDDDMFNFKLDFIMLFLSTMVETGTDGKCMVSILFQLSIRVNFEEINWCKYVIDAMKYCKNGWQREFKGPLAILTLLYVENITCEEMLRDREIPPIAFWNDTRLGYIENLMNPEGGHGVFVKMAEDEDVEDDEEYSMK